MNRLVSAMGFRGPELVDVGRIVSHYRLMARISPRSAGFWRTAARAAIRQFREQNAEPERLAA